MPNSWSAKREREYDHIKSSLRQRGKSEKVAEEIAARTVNKDRAQHGEAKHPSKLSLKDKPAAQRGGERSHKGEGGRTRAQLYEEAKHRGIEGRSSMNKSQLQRAVDRK